MIARPEQITKALRECKEYVDMISHALSDESIGQEESWEESLGALFTGRVALHYHIAWRMNDSTGSGGHQVGGSHNPAAPKLASISAANGSLVKP